MDIYNLIKDGFEIWDEGKKIDCIAGGINSDGEIWVRKSEDNSPKPQIYNVLGNDIEIKVKPSIKNEKENDINSLAKKILNEDWDSMDTRLFHAIVKKAYAYTKEISDIANGKTTLKKPKPLKLETIQRP